MAIIPGNPPGTPMPSPIPTPLVIMEKFYDRTKDLQYAIFLSLGGTDAEIEEKFLDRGDDLLYAILKKITGGGYNPPDPSEFNRLVSGNATWNNNLIFDVTACVYFIAGVLYTSPATQVTLEPAYATNPRIDVIYVDKNGNTGIVAGDPSPNPSKPGIDLDTQIEITFVNVPAGSVVPGGIVNEDVYQNNEEWATSTDIITNDENIFDQTGNPQSGNKNIGVTDMVRNGSLIFTKDALLSANNYNFLRFYIRVDVPLTTKFGDILSIYFWNGTDIVSSPAKVLQHGFDPELLNEWQLITIPISRFAFTTSNFNKVTFKMTTSIGETGAFSMDNVVLQGLAVVNGGDGVLSRFGIEDHDAGNTARNVNMNGGHFKMSSESRDPDAIQFESSNEGVKTIMKMGGGLWRLNYMDSDTGVQTSELILQPVGFGFTNIQNSDGFIYDQLSRIFKLRKSDLLVDDHEKGIILRSPNGTTYRYTAADDGTLTPTPILI